MKKRNREITIFSLSLMDVISGAMGAFLIVMIIQMRFVSINEGRDPEDLRPRLDAAKEALASIRAGTEKTIAGRFQEGSKPRSAGLSNGESVPEITALGTALEQDVDRIDAGLARALEGRAAAVDALAGASAGTEETIKTYISDNDAATLGLRRSFEAPEIRALDQALRKDIALIEKGLDNAIDQRNAAVDALKAASTGTEKIIKDRVGTSPETQGIKASHNSPPEETKKLDQALRTDIATIYRELRKSTGYRPKIPFVVTTVFPCEDGDVSLQIASNEIDPRTGKPLPPYTPVPDQGAIKRTGSWSLLNASLHGSGSSYSLRQPAFTYMNSHGVPGKQYRIYLIGFSGACAGHVIMLGTGIREGTGGRSLPVRFNEGERVKLGWPRDSIVLDDGKRYGMFFLGTIRVSEDFRLAYARATEQEREAEMRAMQARVDGKGNTDDRKDDGSHDREAVLAKFEKFAVPDSVPSCGRMFAAARQTLIEMKLSSAETAKALNAVLDDCRVGRFPNALKKLKSEMRRVLAKENDLDRTKNASRAVEKKDDKNDKSQQDKNARPPQSKETALAIFDKLPIPNNTPGCMRLHVMAERTMREFKVSSDARTAVLNEVRTSCREKRYSAALDTLKTQMRRLLK